MRATIIKLCGLALLSLGATSTTSCESLLMALIGDSLIPDLSIRVHILNDSNVPVSVQLVSSEGGIEQAAAVLAKEETDDTDDTDGTDETDDTAGGTLDPGEEQKLTFLCAAMPPALAVEATADGEGENLPSATSKILRVDVDYECGDRINFTVRSVAGGGLVVGANVNEGGAD